MQHFIQIRCPLLLLSSGYLSLRGLLLLIQLMLIFSFSCFSSGIGCFFDFVGGIDLVNFDVFIRQTLPSSLSIDFQVIRLLHLFDLGICSVVCSIESA